MNRNLTQRRKGRKDAKQRREDVRENGKMRIQNLILTHLTVLTLPCAFAFLAPLALNSEMEASMSLTITTAQVIFLVVGLSVGAVVMHIIGRKSTGEGLLSKLFTSNQGV